MLVTNTNSYKIANEDNTRDIQLKTKTLLLNDTLQSQKHELYYQEQQKQGTRGWQTPREIGWRQCAL